MTKKIKDEELDNVTGAGGTQTPFQRRRAVLERPTRTGGEEGGGGVDQDDNVITQNPPGGNSPLMGN